MRAIRWASGFDAVWSGLVFDPRGEMTSGWNDAPMEEKPIALSSKTGLRHAALPRKIRSAWVHRASGANTARIFLASYGFTPRTNVRLSRLVNPTGSFLALPVDFFCIHYLLTTTTSPVILAPHGRIVGPR